MKLKPVSAAALVASSAWILSMAIADENKQGDSGEPAAPPSETETPNATEAERPEPKPLSGNVQKALAYLAEVQNENGGWGQGGGWMNQNGRRLWPG